MSSPTPERIHLKKLARLRKRRTIRAYNRAGVHSDGRPIGPDEEPIEPFGFRTRPRK